MKIIKLTLVLSILTSCAGIPGRNIKLDDYPEVKKFNDLSIVYKDGELYGKIDYEHNFNKKISKNFESKKIFSNELNTKISENCIIKISSKKSLGMCPITNLISPITLTILPYYCQHIYEIKAILVSADSRILKEYDLRDKVHEVWSLIWMLNPWSWDEPSPEYGKDIVENKISEALVRQVLNDASTFKECKKK